MSIKLNVKRIIFRSLEFLPRKIGDRLYHYLQKKGTDISLDQKFNAGYATYLSLEEILIGLGKNVKNKKVLEIGSGWVPIIPYFLKFKGEASAVYTYDINMHYNKKSIEAVNNMFSRRSGISIKEYDDNDLNLPKGIKYYPKTDLGKSAIPQADIVFSRFVLEHIPPIEIIRIHQNIQYSLTPGSLIVHFISPGDHWAYDNPDLSLQNFLQYSEIEWKQKQTRFDYHNRLRLPQYVAIFEDLGLEIVHLSFETPDKESKTYHKFKQLKIHSDFQKYSDEDLTAGAINIVLRVKD